MNKVLRSLKGLVPLRLRQRIKRDLLDYFEVPTAEWSLNNLRRLGFAPARILDVGAYKGEWTQLARNIFPDASVLMLEAQEERIPDLETLKRAHGGKVDYRIVLLGAEERKEVVFNKYPNAPTGNSVLSDWRTDSVKIQVKCPMRPLDAVLEETGFRPVDLIKLDVQGYELEVLKGASACLQTARALMMEVSLIDMYQNNPLLHDVTAFLRQHGFVAYDICGLMRRPLDMALAQVDMLFVPSSRRCAPANTTGGRRNLSGSKPDCRAMQVLLVTTRNWYLPQTARAFAARNALAGLWMADKNSTRVPPELYRRCWPYHLAMKPFYHLTPQIWVERASYALIGFWKLWLRRQLHPRRCPAFDVAQAIMGLGSELFDAAEKRGALKVVDCPNSHPTTYYGFWQRECDLWCPGERVPIPRWMFARMNRELERADLVLCPSVFVRDTMVANGIPSEKCCVNPFGVDTRVFQPRPAPPAQPRFICVGTICLRKGHQYLFRAFQRVKATLPDAELICVTDIGFKHDFRRERPLWEGSFTAYRRLDHKSLAALLCTCSAFVLASVEEGFARVLSEAMAAALPIIATYETGATTLITHEVEGLIVPGRNPEKLAEAMVRLATDRELNERMGRAAWRKGAAQNTWQDYGDRLLAEYEARLRARRAA